MCFVWGPACRVHWSKVENTSLPIRARIHCPQREHWSLISTSLISDYYRPTHKCKLLGSLIWCKTIIPIMHCFPAGLCCGSTASEQGNAFYPPSSLRNIPAPLLLALTEAVRMNSPETSQVRLVSSLLPTANSRSVKSAVEETRIWFLGGKDFWRREWQLTPDFLPGEFHGQRSLVACSPWGHIESDMTVWLTRSLSVKNSTICFEVYALWPKHSLLLTFSWVPVYSFSFPTSWPLALRMASPFTWAA